MYKARERESMENLPPMERNKNQRWKGEEKEQNENKRASKSDINKSQDDPMIQGLRKIQ